MFICIFTQTYIKFLYKIIKKLNLFLKFVQSLHFSSSYSKKNKDFSVIKYLFY